MSDDPYIITCADATGVHYLLLFPEDWDINFQWIDRPQAATKFEMREAFAITQGFRNTRKNDELEVYFAQRFKF